MHLMGVIKIAAYQFQTWFSPDFRLAMWAGVTRFNLFARCLLQLLTRQQVTEQVPNRTVEEGGNRIVLKSLLYTRAAEILIPGLILFPWLTGW
jgi:hypothetical protein